MTLLYLLIGVSQRADTTSNTQILTLKTASTRSQHVANVIIVLQTDKCGSLNISKHDIVEMLTAQRIA